MTAEMGPQDALMFPEAALPLPGPVEHDFPQVSSHRGHGPCSWQWGQMPCLHLHALHNVQPEEREGEAAGQTTPRSQRPPPCCAVSAGN